MSTVGELIKANSTAPAGSTVGEHLQAQSGTASATAIADAVRSELTTELAAIIKLQKTTINKREIKKIGDVWWLLIYDDDGTTEILSKELRDIEGNAITDLTAGQLAQEMSSVV